VIAFPRSHVIRKREANRFGLACHRKINRTTKLAAFVGFARKHVAETALFIYSHEITRFGFGWYLMLAIAIGDSSFIRSGLPLRYRHKRLAVRQTGHYKRFSTPASSFSRKKLRAFERFILCSLVRSRKVVEKAFRVKTRTGPKVTTQTSLFLSSYRYRNK
jgi:hypothetical protein